MSKELKQAIVEEITSTTHLYNSLHPSKIIKKKKKGKNIEIYTCPCCGQPIRNPNKKDLGKKYFKEERGEENEQILLFNYSDWK